MIRVLSEDSCEFHTPDDSYVYGVIVINGRFSVPFNEVITRCRYCLNGYSAAIIKPESIGIIVWYLAINLNVTVFF